MTGPPLFDSTRTRNRGEFPSHPSWSDRRQMPVVELFSTRKKAAANSGKAEVYQYAKVPVALRVQLQQLLLDAIGRAYEPAAYEFQGPPPNNNEAWEFVRDAVCREHGRYRLANSNERTAAGDVLQCIGNEQDTDILLDVVELCLRYIDKVLRPFGPYERTQHAIKQGATEAINEANHRFRMAGFGYQYEAEQLMRVDSQYAHAEVVKPALTLLSRPGFSGPQKEFLEAHQHYRLGDYKEAVTAAGCAFESVMKAVCDKKGWSYSSGARATDLYKLLKSKGLFPDYLDNSFEQLISTLKSGLPQVRNEEGAHGAGATPRQTPDYIAGYALHLAAAKIILIVQASGL